VQTRLDRLAFPTVLASAMGTSTFALAVYSVLAVELIEEFDVARWQIGALVTANSLIGALASPSVGSVSDRLGARRAVIATIVLSIVALAGISAAPSYGLLVVAAFAGGVAQSFANPSTNKLISLHVEPGRRGVITGIKQSGVQFGTFMAGMALPALTVVFGWRVAVAVFAGLAVAAVLLAVTTVPHDPPSAHDVVGGSVGGLLPPIVYRLAVYGFLLGSAGTAIFTYLPLYAEERLGFSSSAAGAAVAVSGLVGIVARITWGRIAEHTLGAGRSLLVIAGLAVAAACTLAAAEAVPPLLWVGVILTGSSASAWNTVGMLAIIQTVPSTRAGRGSGVVLLGFLAGLALGAPLFGWSVDVLGTYTPGWVAAAFVFALGGAVMLPPRSSRQQAKSGGDNS
jgi:predicted MFS family arabinose efflux permease